MLDKLFTHILDMTTTGSIVIAVVLLARLALKRTPKIFSYCLWAVVLLRLLCPVDISTPVSLVPRVPSVSENYSLADKQITFSSAGTAVMDSIDNVTNHNPDTYFVEIQPSVQAGPAPTITCSPWEVWVLLGQYVWAAGVVVMALLSLMKLLRLRRRLSEAVPVRHNIYQADGITTPFVMGLILPKIYLPSGLTEAEQDYVLRHEQHHIRRLDHVSKALGFVALCLHWFNPLVWLAFTLAGQDMEMSCDEAVIKKLGSHMRADYSQSLLRFSTGRTTIAGVPLAFGEGDAGKRIRNLQKWKQPACWLTALATAICVVLTVGCATVGAKEAPTTNGSIEVLQGSNALLILDVEDEAYDPNEEHLFQLPEYPGISFLRSGSSVYVQENGTWRSLLHGYAIYVADLNGDGKREFCGTYTVGSGFIVHRIQVYDFVDDMHYCLGQSPSYDCDLHIEDGLLAVDIYEHMGMFYEKAPVSQGGLVLKDRQLSFVSGETVVPGQPISVRFDPEALASMCSEIQSDMDWGRWFDIYFNFATDYYMERHMDDILPLIIEEEERRVWLDSALAQDNTDTLQHLVLLKMITTPYLTVTYERYFYYDPAKPAELFICTELRDCGYRDIQSYYEDLTAGKCQAHPDTYIIRLDERAVYRWGETENLYAALDK